MEAYKQVLQNKQGNLFFSVDLVLQQVDQHQKKKDTQVGQQTFCDIVHNEGWAHGTEPELNHACHAVSSLRPVRLFAETICRRSTHLSFHARRVEHHGCVLPSIVRTTWRQMRESSWRQDSRFYRRLRTKFHLDKDQLKKVSQHQVAATPCLRWQQQRLTSDWFHHRPHHGLDLVWRCMRAAGLLGLRTFLSHAWCNDSVRREVVGAVHGLCSTWHDSTQHCSKCPSFIHQGMTMRSNCNVSDDSATLRHDLFASGTRVPDVMRAPLLGPVVHGASSAPTSALPLATAARNLRLSVSPTDRSAAPSPQVSFRLTSLWTRWVEERPHQRRASGMPVPGESGRDALRLGWNGSHGW